jgi:hypothetical protein
MVRKSKKVVEPVAEVEADVESPEASELDEGMDASADADDDEADVEDDDLEDDTEAPEDTEALVAVGTREIKPIENCEHQEIRQKVLDIRGRLEAMNWEMAEALHAIYDKSLYLSWGYATWREYVAGELDFRLRKAQYFLAAREWFNKLPKTMRNFFEQYGWTIIRELVAVVTPENAAEWKQKIEGKSRREIIALVTGAQKFYEAGDDENEEKDAGDGTAKSKQPKTEEKAISWTARLYPAQQHNVDMAVEKAMDLAGTDNKGHAIDLICTEYLAMNAGTMNIKEYLAKVERSSGVRLVALDPKADDVVYGAELLDTLAALDNVVDGAALAEQTGFPDFTQDLAGFLAAVQEKTKIRIIALSADMETVAFGKDTLDALAGEGGDAEG